MYYYRGAQDAFVLGTGEGTSLFSYELRQTASASGI